MESPSGSLTRTFSGSSTQSGGHAISHKHRQPPPPPIPSRRHSRFSFSMSGVLPTPDLLSSIPSGAHYVGSPPTGHGEHPAMHGRHKRSSSQTTDDPSVYKEALDDMREIYCGRATVEILRRRWRNDAEFEDPLCVCKGYEQYAPQWFALPRIFSNCEQTYMRILSATLDPNRLVYAQTMVYTYRWIGYKRTLESIIRIDFDDEFKVIRLMDQWNGEQPSTRWGYLHFRKFNAKVVPWLVRVPKEKTA